MTAPKLDHADIPTDPETPPETPEGQPSSLDNTASPNEDSGAAATEEACVVVKEDATPRGRRLADEARQVAAAHASLLVDIEACKRVSMTRARSLLFTFSCFVLCLSRFLNVSTWVFYLSKPIILIDKTPCSN